jgi:hypothetical protein
VHRRGGRFTRAVAEAVNHAVGPAFHMGSTPAPCAAAGRGRACAGRVRGACRVRTRGSPRLHPCRAPASGARVEACGACARRVPMHRTRARYRRARARVRARAGVATPGVQCQGGICQCFCCTPNTMTRSSRVRRSAPALHDDATGTETAIAQGAQDATGAAEEHEAGSLRDEEEGSAHRPGGAWLDVGHCPVRVRP